MTEQDIHIEQLMMEKLSGIIDGADLAELETLLATDELIRGRWDKLKANFDRAGSRSYLDRLDTAEALSRLRQTTTAKEPDRRILLRRMAIAASLAIPLMMAGLLYFHKKPVLPLAGTTAPPEKSVKLYLGAGNKVLTLSQANAIVDSTDLKNIKLNIGNGSLSYVPLNGHSDNTLNTLVVPATMTYDLMLADGVEVWLNSESQLKFPFSFSGDQREVWVSGEAYFKVTKDAHRPLIVHTPSYDIQVLGTEFNVNTYDSLHSSTALVTGAINTRTAKGAPVMVRPGYQAVLGKGNTFQLKTFDSDNELSWMKGVYYFQDTPLEDIAPAIRRWYGTALVFDDPNVAGSRFTGALRKNKPLNEFLDNLFLTSKISYKTTNGVVHLASH